jgi:serine/threonine protein phosphatase PrpC
VDEFMPIGEFSERSGLSVNRLRTYAAEGLLVPAAVDPASGYRYYSPGQLPEAQMIDTLRQAGMPLADIRVLVHQPSLEKLDAWARRLETDARHREKALDRARHLMVTRGQATFPSIPYEDPEEVMMTRLRTAGRTETGHVRQHNEDAIVSGERLAVVADGMGGPPGGEVAATTAAALLRAAFTGRSRDELEAAVRAANWAIWDRAAHSPELGGMGTTICAAGLLDDRRMAFVNVGDSRAYLWREGTLIQLTQDHSVTAELVQRGELLEEEAPRHPHYGVLTRALGVGPDVEIDSTTHLLSAEDRVVICSDGLFNELSPRDIASVMTKCENLAAVADSLVERALTSGGQDNVSVVVAEVAV